MHCIVEHSEILIRLTECIYAFCADLRTKNNYISLQQQMTGFLGVFGKLRKATIRFLVSVCPSVHMEEFTSHWIHLHEIRQFNIFFVFENPSRKFEFQ